MNETKADLTRKTDIEQKENEAKRIGYKILALAKDSVLHELPLFERAAARLVCAANDTLGLASDGGLLLFEPWYLFSLFRQGQSLVNRAWLHTLLHALLCHSLVGGKIKRPLWDLACDVAVENIIREFDSPQLISPNEEAQALFTEGLRGQGIRLTAEQLYKAFCDSLLSEEQAQEIRERFFVDQHILWYENDRKPGETVKVDLGEEWKQLAQKLEAQLSSGNTGSALAQNLHELCRSGKSYTRFLRRFGRTREIMRLSQDEYDRNYYAFGMDHYGNIPLIEPLEYSDRKRLRDLVIAIDTSGSVKGELVERFIQHSYDILMSSEQFEQRFHVMLVQCDEQIHEKVSVHTREEFARYAGSLTVKGLGGTDFRPVFQMMEEEIKSGRLAPDSALLYFTDGDGEYPEEKPAWETAFVLFGEAWKKREIPDWAESLILREEDILDGVL